MADDSQLSTDATILVVDDNPENCIVLEEFLKSMGYWVEVAIDGEEALDKAEASRPDLILLDILMPETDGFEVCRRLKKMPGFAEVPIMFMSALGDLESRLEGFRAGAVDYIPKPFQLPEIVARVNAHIQLRKQRQYISEINEQLGQRIAERTEQLNRLNDRMAGILSSVTDAILLLDKDGNIDNTNFGFDEMFGYAPDELFRRHIRKIVHPTHIDEVDRAFKQVRDGALKTSLYIDGIRKDGTPIAVDISFSRIPRESDYFVCTCHDITYLKEMERLKVNFISMVSHELRTPITAILLIAGTITTHYDRMNDDQRRKRVAQLHAQTKLLSELVESVLDIARLEARRGRHNYDPVDVVAVAGTIIEELADSAHKKELGIEVEFPDEPMIVLGDPVDIGRIWRNLINNAIKYTSNGGKIITRIDKLHITDTLDTITGLPLPPAFIAPPPGSYVIGQVQDTGHGFAPEDLEGLFTRFHRGWAKQSNIPGTGLGLALVKELLESYSGDIGLASVLHQGSTFTFWIPMKLAAQEKDTLS